MRESREFFNVQPIRQALDLLFSHWNPIRQTEHISTFDALGRVTAKAPTSPHALPIFRRSTMDGYAVRAEDTFGASQSLPAYLTLIGSVPMGHTPTIDLATAQAVEIHTGGMLPKGANAVVMLERTQKVNHTEIEIMTSVAPGENIVQVGEDVAEGATVLPVGHRIRPQDIGGLLAVAITEIEVIKLPRVGILSGGDELVPPHQQPDLGQVRDINTYTLSALVLEIGAEPVTLGIAKDNFDSYQALARQGFEETDVLVVTAGSSVSSRDLTRDVIQSLGQPGILQHGLAVKPGKPTILAICNGKPVIGLPGNPVSALSVAQQILIPILYHALGIEVRWQASLKATLATNISSTAGREDRMPVKLRETTNGLVAEPVFGKSNLIYTLVNADGWVDIPLNSNGLRAGTLIDVFPFNKI